MQLLPPDTVIPQQNIRISERLSSAKAPVVPKKQTSKFGIIDEESESTSVGNDYTDFDAKHLDHSEVIESNAFKNSVFHPDFENKLMKK